ncbi:Uncharacterised protein [Acinetobacter baumannii]|nr:Uncharacterised protein [Acinetobacter baumannii]
MQFKLTAISVHSTHGLLPLFNLMKIMRCVFGIQQFLIKIKQMLKLVKLLQSINRAYMLLAVKIHLFV